MVLACTLSKVALFESNIVNDDKNKAGWSTIEREKNKIWREKEIKKRTWMRNEHLPDEEDRFTHRSTWRVTYSLTFHLWSNTLSICCHGVLRTNQHLSLSLSGFHLMPFRIMCGPPLLYICLSINYEPEALTNTLKIPHDPWLTAARFIMTTRLYLVLLWPLDLLIESLSSLT